MRDLQLLHDIAKELKDEERGFTALYVANEIINLLQLEDADASNRALSLSSQFFAEGNGAGQHVIHAVGHCHMDCAWLWPYDETKRKCSRSWSATLELMDRYPEWTFACSSAQQYKWVQTLYPGLFQRIKQSVASGRFIPVGGSWVEMDGYLPSGESMCRQMLFGQKYFIENFGIQCTEFWLPDTFGYSAQLPQIIQHFGMTRFFTQKISWNLFNKFPHHTFFWKGLDGSKVLSHFAPGDSYHMEAKVGEFVKTIRNFEDKGRSCKSIFLFGHGDGGQGPTEDMLENLKRLKDVNGLPRVKLSTPGEFFSSIEQTDLQNLCTWSGELYLEMHNGTYTTQSKIKWYNRRCESLLHTLEFLGTLCYVSNLREYPFKELDAIWESVLLNQFHDVLPGSSVEIANIDARKIYFQALSSGTTLLTDLLHTLSTENSAHEVGNAPTHLPTVVNSLGWSRTEVVAVEHTPCVEQKDSEGNSYCLVTVCGYSVSPCTPCIEYHPVTVRQTSFADGSGETIIMSNNKVYAEIDRAGCLTVLKYVLDPISQTYSRNLLSGNANQFTLYDDIPLFWDAWDVMDYHQETRRCLTEVLTSAIVKEEGPLRCSVEWNENRKFLKVEFPLDIVSDHVTYESQFGHIRRPTHRNTSWDSAKYEVCCQKWMDLSDYSSGVAILNDCKYGCSVTQYSTLSLSLLRAPKSPDPTADMGSHQFTYAILPHGGSIQDSGVIQSAAALNTPLIVMDEVPKVAASSLFTTDQPSVVIDTVKLSEDSRETGSRCVIIRCYESFGGSCEATLSLSPNYTMSSAKECNGLEREVEDLKIKQHSFTASFGPFKVKTFKILF
ncbi:MAN2C1 [Bugula neritina]|uniref:alpha-mannosidase n=1 Tax=Bugula neritina TaxID=10212 RepID=A0A7J7JBT6_BUGNE|nr:MAN2C1 [Bugula neritina]